MKIYFKKKNPVSNYIWRRTFCFLPRFVKDFYGETSPLVWLSWVYRRGPFSPSDDVANQDKFGITRFEKRGTNGRYEYRLDCPPPNHSIHLPADSAIMSMLIDSPSEYRRKYAEDFFQKEKIQAWIKDALGDKTLFNEKYYPGYGNAPDPIEEGAGMKK